MAQDKEYLIDTLLAKGGGRDQFIYSMGCIIGDAITHVLDGGETLDELEACEKTYIGTKIEKLALKRYSLPNKKSSPRPKLDTVIAGVDFDIKTTLGSNWMIPPEAHHQWCVLVRSNVPSGLYSLGVLHMDPANLTRGGNRDGKLTVCAQGKKNITWVAVDERIVYRKDKG